MSQTSEKLTSLIGDVQALEKHRDDLSARADALDGIVAGLQAQLASKTSTRDAKLVTVLSTALRLFAERVPYIFGAEYPKGVDCSAYMQFCFAKVGVGLPRTSINQSKYGVNAPEPIIGDLLFFDTNKDGVINHVGLYIGNDLMIHTAKPEEGINICNYKKRYGTMFKGARRVI